MERSNSNGPDRPRRQGGKDKSSGVAATVQVVGPVLTGSAAINRRTGSSGRNGTQARVTLGTTLTAPTRPTDAPNATQSTISPRAQPNLPARRGPSRGQVSSVQISVDTSNTVTVPPYIDSVAKGVDGPKRPQQGERIVDASIADTTWSQRKRLTVMNYTMAAFHFGLVLVTCFVGNVRLTAPMYSTKLNFQTSNDTTGFVLVPTYEEKYDLPLTLVTATFFAISATFHFGNAIVWREHYIQWIADKKSPTRWMEYYFSASVMILLIGYTTGLRSFVELLFALFLVATTMTFGWLSDTANRPMSEDRWTNPSLASRLVPHLLGYPPLIVVWAGLIFTLAENSNECGPPTYVYALVFGEMVLFMSFGIPQMYQIISIPRNYIYGEYAYQIMSLVAKGMLGGILLAYVLLFDTFDQSVLESTANSTNCSFG